MNQQPIDRLQLKQLEAVMDVVVSRFAVECGLLKPYLDDYTSLQTIWSRYGRSMGR